MQNIKFISNFFFEIYCKDIANLLFWELWECLTIPIKIIVSICRKPSCLFACKKSTSSITSFLRYCKEIANLTWSPWPHRAGKIRFPGTQKQVQENAARLVIFCAPCDVRRYICSPHRLPCHVPNKKDYGKINVETNSGAAVSTRTTSLI